MHTYTTSNDAKHDVLPTSNSNVAYVVIDSNSAVTLIRQCSAELQ